MKRPYLWSDAHLDYSYITKTEVQVSFFFNSLLLFWNLYLQPSALPLVPAHSMCTTHLCKSVLGNFGSLDLNTACLLI